VNLVASAAAAIAVAAVLGLLIDRLVYMPITYRGGGTFAMFIASLGLTLIFGALFLLLTRGTVSVARTENLAILSAGNLAIRVYDVVVVGAVSLLYLVLYVWLRRTRSGLGVLALTDNSGLAAAVGVKVDRVRVVVFLVASALAGLSGVFTTYDSGIVPTTGLDLLFIVLVAVILGGTRNVLLGSLAGSIVIGLVTGFAGFFLPQWVTVSVFLILIMLLIGRPAGLLG
jgi:branched-chain amino acid transport system permease protein